MTTPDDIDEILAIVNHAIVSDDLSLEVDAKVVRDLLEWRNRYTQRKCLQTRISELKELQRQPVFKRDSETNKEDNYTDHIRKVHRNIIRSQVENTINKGITTLQQELEGMKNE